MVDAPRVDRALGRSCRRGDLSIRATFIAQLTQTVTFAEGGRSGVESDVLLESGASGILDNDVG